ncbi:ATP synthase F1 subunit epsilon [Candidatus Roizmanbacteria bacterium RIFCSPLOWO2_01_FULL_37_12]|uniref:ATP synthase epsilon chain n=1 Tax=Candidatus Roizmanbacteria bacterium RIFCSPLOWO2_01_FULL_37_12 TaxID=1802056 RepID=A0A1F7I944_9BACT|nr:MAG: ATP synthase F1 subunit epsilon [Candidatus Roizmanbacteria bacterium RIFCSPHIGHO2_02_FULL_37_9b]OGK39869.1 MAG: ATP synthase F1 subunit epsilon [Candidatus Roizmanbacteria bacterium RIFCSPLOWO2_01_FULL_37_12]
MAVLHLKIITPQKIALEEDVLSVTAPSAQGEITVLPQHSNLFTLLKEGIVKIKPVYAKVPEDKEKYLAIGGGYLETDGEEINILVSRAYGQDEIDAEKTQKAIDEAQKTISLAKDESQRKQAISLLRRSVLNLKLMKRKKRPSS